MATKATIHFDVGPWSIPITGYFPRYGALDLKKEHQRDAFEVGAGILAVAMGEWVVDGLPSDLAF